MKILRIIGRMNVGGPANQAALLTRELSARGHECILVHGRLGAAEPSMEYLLQGLRNVHYLPAMRREPSPLQDATAIAQLASLMRRERPDLVHTHTAKAGALGRTAAMLAGIPNRVHTFHGHVFDGYFSEWKTNVYLEIERRLARHTDVLVAISPSQAQELACRYELRPRRGVATIPLGFNLERFLNLPILRELSGERLRVGWVGRFTAIKDPELFVRAAELCAIPAKYVMVGDGELRADTEAAARSGRLDVRFTGVLSDMPSVYAELDMVVLTSANEGTPVVLIEAMASGVPFVATDVGGVQDLMVGVAEQHPGFRVFENGILVDARDPSSLANAMEFLGVRPELRRHMGVRSRVFAERFRVSRLVADIENLYTSLCAPELVAEPAEI